jgi:hypothetical protein
VVPVSNLGANPADSLRCSDDTGVDLVQAGGASQASIAAPVMQQCLLACIGNSSSNRSGQ